MKRPLLPLILLVIGAVFLVIAVVAGIRTAAFLHTAAHTTGRVTDQTPVSTTVTGRRPTTTYRPTVTFQTPDGRWIVVTSSVSSNSAHQSGSGWVNTTPKVHDQVPIVYDPASPTHAEVDSFGRLWIKSLVFGFLGIMFGGFGLIFSTLARQP